MQKILDLLPNTFAYLFIGSVIFAVYAIATSSGSGGDRFFDNIEIPPNLEYELPGKWPPVVTEATDEYQAFVERAFLNQKKSKPEIEVRIDNLEAAVADNPELLERFLATHCGWRLAEDARKKAQRRWAQNGYWLSPLGGHDSHYYTTSSQPKYTTSLLLDWCQHTPTLIPPPTAATNGDTMTPSLNAGVLYPYGSDCFLRVGDEVQIRITEGSGAKNRAVTQASIDFINNEFSAVARATQWSDLKATLEPHIHRGPRFLELFREAYPPTLTREEGSYSMCLWINPGEPGAIYLKAFEATENRPLSEYMLRTNTLETIGWSKDKEEKFFANSTFAIREGSPGNPYVVRFEVWFIPAGGKEERKLMQKTILIEGTGHYRG